MAVKLWSKNGTISSVVSTGGVITSVVSSGIAAGSYVGNIALSGGTSTTANGYQIITFTGSGSFVPSASGNVELMMIGGGGAGTADATIGVAEPGASSGGMVLYSSQTYPFSYGTSITLYSGVTYTVTIGGGGAPTAAGGANGTSSTLVGGNISLTAYGGGKSIGTGASTFVNRMGPGAGASYYGTTWGATGNAAPNQGFNGSWAGWSSLYGGGSNDYHWQCGGSGLGSQGGSGSAANANNGIPDLAKGQGGRGFYTNMSGTFAYYGAGGCGGVNAYHLWNGSPANAAPGGGGVSAGYNNSGVGTAASANTGSGGAGASYGGAGFNGTAGGSGILIIRYPAT